MEIRKRSLRYWRKLKCCLIENQAANLRIGPVAPAERGETRGDGEERERERKKIIMFVSPLWRK